MHFAFATWQLALPMGVGMGDVPLQSCLADYTKLEVLTDCICRRCSIGATQARLKEDVEKLEKEVKLADSGTFSVLAEVEKKEKEKELQDSQESEKAPVEKSGSAKSKKKKKGRDKDKDREKDRERLRNKLTEMKALEAKVAKAIAEGRIEEDIRGVTMERFFSRASTKQAMVARVSKPNLRWNSH